MKAAPAARAGVTVSPSMKGASSTFQTTASPAHGAMMLWAAYEYAVTSKSGSMIAVSRRPSG